MLVGPTSLCSGFYHLVVLSVEGQSTFTLISTTISLYDIIYSIFVCRLIPQKKIILRVFCFTLRRVITWKFETISIHLKYTWLSCSRPHEIDEMTVIFSEYLVSSSNTCRIFLMFLTLSAFELNT